MYICPALLNISSK